MGKNIRFTRCLFMGKIIRSTIDFLYVKGNCLSTHKLPMIQPPTGTYYLTYNVTLRQLVSCCLGHIPNIAYKNELCYEFANHFTDIIQRTCTSISYRLSISSISWIFISKPIPYYFSKFYMSSIFTISNLISKSSSSHSSEPINLAAFKN